MTPADLQALTLRLRQHPGLRGKEEIQAPARTFPPLPFPELGPAAALGDDAALIPGVTGPLLLASEGMDPQLVDDDPWFAGWSGVLVNLSDIAAMGGNPLAVVNSLWATGEQHAERLLAGMRFASDTFAVPMVGGHTNLHSPYNALSVAVLGTTPGPVLSARAARPGDRCHLLVNIKGHFHRHYPFWDAATEAEPARLRRHLALLVELAGARIVHGAKDISMGGLVGTAVMFAEAAHCRLELDLEALQPPGGVELEAWLTCFPSYGYLLAVDPSQSAALRHATGIDPDLLCVEIGRFQSGDAELVLSAAGACQRVWHQQDPLTGFGALNDLGQEHL
ncbi:sll0787 family AIR synthase-like protein [Synechococcus sp. CBW1002]|jgi:AIR synthase-related protein|uniref:sll0787 family AIR synthase-like protein n=1 Tax=Synechococcus sp. CBW1002 TaxID=1353134 RepID=UPI0018CEFBE7|nr:sll0787 family AIR synthase-like protein [Synechococcus sp. CBW1002]QPN60432.1 sll0787 family AIR synthase-like protein [Synechococcus sp. CBW1002]